MSSPPFYLNVVTVNDCGQTLVPGDMIFVTWTFTGTPNYDSCYVGVRPILNINTTVADTGTLHPQCGGSSTNIQIPPARQNQPFPFNGSEFTVRVNTPQDNGIYADSCTFRIATSRPSTWGTADTLSVISLCMSFFSAIVLTVFFKWLDTHRENQRIEREYQEQRPAHGQGQAQPPPAANLGQAAHAPPLAPPIIHLPAQPVANPGQVPPPPPPVHGAPRVYG